MSESRTYTVTETAERLGIPRSTLYDQIRRDAVPHLRPIRIGTRTVFPRAHIDALLEGEAA